MWWSILKNHIIKMKHHIAYVVTGYTFLTHCVYFIEAFYLFYVLQEDVNSDFVFYPCLQLDYCLLYHIKFKKEHHILQCKNYTLL